MKKVQEGVGRENLVEKYTGGWILKDYHGKKMFDVIYELLLEVKSCNKN